MIIYNKLDNYFVVSADRQTVLGFEMTANLRDTSPLSTDVRDVFVSYVRLLVLLAKGWKILVVVSCIYVAFHYRYCRV